MNNDDILIELRELRHEFESNPPLGGRDYVVRLRRIDALKRVEQMLTDKGPRLDEVDP